MNEFLQYQRNLARFIVLLAVVGIVAFKMAMPEAPDCIWGWIVGCIGGMVIFRLRVMNIVSLPNLPQGDWGKANLKNSMISFAIMAVVLVASVFIDFLNPYAVFGGIVLERAVLIGDGILRPSALSDVAGAEVAETGGEA